MMRQFQSVLSTTLRQARRFWREDGGFLVSTEWLFWATIVAIGTIGAVMALRYAAREVFVNTATEIAREQSYEFKRAGHVGYRVETTPPQAFASFQRLGETPGKTWETPPKGEASK
ncbi:MAG: hypothetical protein MPJ50_15975 [Pirellulales bacterium]|nr:hypothetical protein [Pirellulales bacterium]